MYKGPRRIKKRKIQYIASESIGGILLFMEVLKEKHITWLCNKNPCKIVSFIIDSVKQDIKKELKGKLSN